MVAATLFGMMVLTAQAGPTFVNPVERAARHPLVREKPAPGFFEGALLGNGGLGAVVTTRPDAIVVHFGHNDVWDIRISERHKDEIGTFQEIFDKVKAIPKHYASLNLDPWYAKYMRMTHENYDKPYPRPFPCGSLLLGFDRRDVELLGHEVDISTGLCRVHLLIRGVPAICQLFVDQAADRLWLRLVDGQGNPIPNCFDRVRLIPDAAAPKDIPRCEVPEEQAGPVLSFRQVLPFNEPQDGKPGEPSPKDRAFRLVLYASEPLVRAEGVIRDLNPEKMGVLERAFSTKGPFVACVQLDQGLASDIAPSPDTAPAGTQGAPASPQAAPASPQAYAKAFAVGKNAWESYWNRSGVALDDEFLEQIWYWNHYFFNCAAKSGVNCPGLFANWSLGNIGTAWHGDYHMNYNTQQPFWLPFSSNRVEKNLAYVELIERLLPLSKQWAKAYYGLRGAYFPHSAYPVEMTMSPYPVPTWGWEICETPWAVQGLWWHYLYTMDKDFLRNRAFAPIQEAVLFLVDYMRRPEAHGGQWGDDKYHVFPTVPPELYGLRPGFKYNNDCLVDLTLIKFVMNAYLEAVRVLGVEEAELVKQVREILAHFPEYPTAESKQGPVFVSVPGERSDIVYNVPNSLMTVFPGEDHGLFSPKEVYDVLANTYRNTQNEGGNELVFLNLQAARLGLLDLERFKRQVNYCLLPDGTCADMVLQVHGRYDDATPYDFMAPMGIWFENFSLPVVINECLLQSVTGTLRLFPNWPKDKSAAFSNLRTVGAFLVSASFARGAAEWIVIRSEAGADLKVVVPWKEGARILCDGAERRFQGSLFEMPTRAGQTIQLLPPVGKGVSAK